MERALVSALKVNEAAARPSATLSPRGGLSPSGAASFKRAVEARSRALKAEFTRAALRVVRSSRALHATPLAVLWS
ncbi:hypothetical protein EYF80_039373 [Liparis tanakae]|uniref:Uncharacterized protein n=1 Tax=Liparis tanakae TaxID=230148 RepID=A0A4Z2GA46_9TELE|nr:hypothetical protein EYF80_039373 [Liparis tanakae]